jgi:hypothetical protein
MRGSRAPVTAERGPASVRRCRSKGLDLLAAQAAIQDVDPETLTAADAGELAQDYLDSVRHLQETADDRHDALFETLESAARDVLLTLESVQDQADYSTWAPLVEDDLEAVGNAAVTVEDALEPQCPDPGGET